MTARIFRLNEMHQRIDDELRRELKRPLPDNLALTRLKRMKLRVKDLLHRAARTAAPQPQPQLQPA
ncbi:hypothetical protein B5C34_13960 [Pacificimonas flava]|uniref:DUF465 domain-containing protein n=2 Tax=Pacificimonas TaxID=1960290 RepID=A0A219B8F6_9SPHN|nr:MULTISPECIES: YdcH family protein [Pacificimonas]MBZ6379931.1 YdcH family protein [Pacificimonas aurantium]OWV34454.1 hypothetical protein B5C34_13960 [Pacificimonas flava]